VIRSSAYQGTQSPPPEICYDTDAISAPRQINATFCVLANSWRGMILKNPGNRGHTKLAAEIMPLARNHISRLMPKQRFKTSNSCFSRWIDFWLITATQCFMSQH